MNEPGDRMDEDSGPAVWHFGLIARWWAEFNEGGPEVSYFREWIERYGEPALDLGCGTGRLLIPYMRDGIDADGCDISADMLQLCREKAGREGLHPQLYRQAMHELDLPRRYRTIVICGGIGLGGSRRNDQAALARCWKHLEDGGALVFDSHLAYKDADEWRLWLKDERQTLPEPWPETGRRRMSTSGDEYELIGRVAALDPLDQAITRQMRVRLWRDGVVVRQEEYTLVDRYYFRNEMLDMLERAGFTDVQVRAGYTQAEAGADSDVLVYVAEK